MLDQFRYAISFLNIFLILYNANITTALLPILYNVYICFITIYDTHYIIQY